MSRKCCQIRAERPNVFYGFTDADERVLIAKNAEGMQEAELGDIIEFRPRQPRCIEGFPPEICAKYFAADPKIIAHSTGKDADGQNTQGELHENNQSLN